MNNNLDRNQLCVFFCLLPIAAMGCSRVSPGFADPPPPKVTVAQPVRQTVTLFEERNGETEATVEADVRARVKGFIQKVAFEAGGRVSAGEVLYLIEPDQYEADRDSQLALLAAARAEISVATANQVKMEAEVLRTQRDFERQEQLLQSKAVSEADYDEALSARDSAVANREAAKANILAAEAEEKKAIASLAQAELNLEYTEVKALIDGRISKTDVKEGNLVDFGVPLAHIVDDTQIFVNFSISDRLMLRLRDAYIEDPREREADNGENAPELWQQIPVFVRTESERTGWVRGKLDYLDQEGVEQATGTYGLRAIMENAEGDFVPGLFVRVRLPIARITDALLIPLRAVQRTQQGDFLSVVGSDNEVERRAVVLGDEMDSWVLVESGLEENESIVVEGLLRARPGIKVEPVATKLSTEDSPLLSVDLFSEEGVTPTVSDDTE